MRFCEMSWEELEQEFKGFLDKISTEELVKSLSEYKIKEDKQYDKDIKKTRI